VDLKNWQTALASSSLLKDIIATPLNSKVSKLSSNLSNVSEIY